MLNEVGKVDGNLLMYRLPSGEPLPDLVEELSELVRRCPSCISLERKALDMWISTVQPSVQGDLLEEPIAEQKRPGASLSGNQLKAYLGHEFGERFKKPASTRLDIEIPEENSNGTA